MVVKAAEQHFSPVEAVEVAEAVVVVKAAEQSIPLLRPLNSLNHCCGC